MAAYDDVLRAHIRGYDARPQVEPTLAALRALLPHATSARFPNAQRLDRASFRARVWSTSYVAHSIADATAFDRALDAFFDAWADDGAFEIPYDTVVLAWPRGA